MKKDRKPPFTKAARDIDTGLGELFGALGSAITDMMEKLDDGTAATVERNQTFDSGRGPVRVHAGVRLRTAAGQESNTTSGTPKPVNPNRPSTPATKPDTLGSPRPVSYDLFEEADTWILTAEIPGVSLEELTLAPDPQGLMIRTLGDRRYETVVALTAPVDPGTLTPTLHNGILTVTIPKPEAHA